MFIKMVNSTTQNAKVSLVLFLGLALYLGAQIPQLRMELRAHDLKDGNFPSTLLFQDMKLAFRDHNAAMIIFSGSSPISRGQFCTIENWAEEKKASLGPDNKVGFLANLKSPTLEANKLRYKPLVEGDCNSPDQSAAIDFSNLHRSPWRSLYVNPEGTDLTVTFSFPDTQEKSQKFDPKILGVLLQDAKNLVSSQNLGLEVFLGGRSAFQWFFLESLIHDGYVHLLILSILVIFWKVIWGSWAGGLLLLGLLATSGFLLLGSMALFQIPVDVLTNGLMLMMWLAGIQDFAFLSHEQVHYQRNWKNVFRKMATPCFYTSLTTILGFASLGTSSLPIIQRFGFCAALGALIEWAVTFWLLPAFLEVFPTSRIWVQPNKHYQIFQRSSLLHFPPSASKVAARAALLLFGISLIGFFNITVDDKPSQNFASGHSYNSTFKHLNLTRNYEGSIFVNINNSLSYLQKLNLIKEIEKLPNVAQVHSIEKVVAYWNSYLPESVAALAFRELSAFEYLKDYLPFDDTFLASNDHYTRATVFVRSMDLSRMNELLTTLSSLCGSDCKAVGEGVIYTDFTLTVTQTLWYSFILTLVLISLVLGWLSYRKRILWKLVLSSFWGPVVMIGICALLKVPLNLTTAIFVTVLAGLTGDNAIQYLFSARKRPIQTGIARQGSCSIILTLLAVICCLGFLKLTFAPLQTLGLLLIAGFLVVLAGDLFLFKILVTNSPSKGTQD